MECPKILIEATLSEGMFSQEYVAVLELLNGGKATLFIDNFLTFKRGEKMYIQAKMINKCPNGDGIKALLPSEAFDIESSWVDVSKDRVIELSGNALYDFEQR